MKIVDKVKKLLALSNSPNIHEAAAAAAKAQELIDQYNINEMMLREEQEESQDVTIIRQTVCRFGGRRSAWWARLLVSKVAEHNGCYTFKSFDGLGQSIMVGCGPAQRLEMVETLSAWLIGEVNRLLKEENNGYGKGWCNSFRRGAVNEIGNRLYNDRKASRKKMREIATSKEKVGTEKNALVRLNNAMVKVDQVLAISTQWVDDNVKGLRTQRAGYVNSSAGYAAGRRAGKRANLSGPRGSLRG